ncbi:MAG: hypothetical protein IKM05_08795 [Clostridia bacterium]|nr:hypothetical protein [Clostridia bacterium]
METVKGPDRNHEEVLLIHLTDQHQSFLLRLCFSCLYDKALAKGVVQETFLKEDPLEKAAAFLMEKAKEKAAGKTAAGKRIRTR